MAISSLETDVLATKPLEKLEVAVVFWARLVFKVLVNGFADLVAVFKVLLAVVPTLLDVLFAKEDKPVVVVVWLVRVAKLEVAAVAVLVPKVEDLAWVVELNGRLKVDDWPALVAWVLVDEKKLPVPAVVLAVLLAPNFVKALLSVVDVAGLF